MIHYLHSYIEGQRVCTCVCMQTHVYFKFLGSKPCITPMYFTEKENLYLVPLANREQGVHVCVYVCVCAKTFIHKGEAGQMKRSIFMPEK